MDNGEELFHGLLQHPTLLPQKSRKSQLRTTAFCPIH